MDVLTLLLPNGPTAPKPKRPSRLKTIQHIEAISTRIFDLAAAQDFDNPDWKTLVTDDYVAYQEYTDKPVSTTRDEFLANYKAFTRANPDYVVELVSMSADVNEKRGLATTWALIRVKGHPANLWKESVMVGWYRRVRGEWSCYRLDGVRGVGWYQEGKVSGLSACGPLKS